MDHDHVLPVVNEERKIGKRTVETGKVRMSTRAHEREEAVDVPLRHDEVDIERVPINKIVDAWVPVRTEGDVTVIPVLEETVVVQKRLFLKEEVRVRLKTREEHRPQRVCLRGEDLVVERIPDEETHFRNEQTCEKTHLPSTEFTLNRNGDSDMMKTIAGLFPSVDDAHAAANDLMANGFSSDSINIVARKGEGMSTESGGSSRSEKTGMGAATGALTGGAIGGVAGLLAAAVGLTIPGVGPALAAGPIISALTGAGVGAAAGGIIGALTKMGIPEDEAHYYAEGVRRGGTLVSAQADDDRMAKQAAEIMDAHNAMDIEGLAADWRSSGWSGFEESEATIPVTEEELKIGKHEVARGGVRVYSHVEETPVEEELSLREEHADVQRRPADRPVSASDKAFQEKSLEISETAEEPVLEKSARVVEDVTLGKEASERKEKIRDKARHTEVDVERAGAQSGTRGRSRYTGPERRRASSMAYTGPERRREPWPGPAPM